MALSQKNLVLIILSGKPFSTSLSLLFIHLNLLYFSDNLSSIAFIFYIVNFKVFFKTHNQWKPLQRSVDGTKLTEKNGVKVGRGGEYKKERGKKRKGEGRGRKGKEWKR